MDQESSRRVIAKIEEAQRCIGNLHSRITNHLNKIKPAINDAELIEDDIASYLQRQIEYVQGLLREAIAALMPK